MVSLNEFNFSVMKIMYFMLLSTYHSLNIISKFVNFFLLIKKVN